MTLREVFHSPPTKAENDWLFLPGDWAAWTLDSKAHFPDLDEDGEPLVGSDMASLDLQETLDVQSIEDVVSWADRLVGRPDDRVRFESFVYYYRFDAFLPKVGAVDPPPREEIVRQMDLEFYNRLGAERADKPCREPGCLRGSVQFSVLCRPHHFKSTRNKECPFDH